MQGMTRILFPVCLLALLLGCDKAAQGPAQGSPLAVVDLNKVFNDSKAAQEGMKLLDAVKERYEPRLKQMQESLAKKSPAGQGQPDAKAEPKEDETSAAFGELISQYQGALNDERGRLSAILDEALGKAMDAVRARRGIKVVLPKESVAAFDPDADITEEVLKELDAMNVSFPPAKAEPTPAEPSKAAPAPQPAPSPQPAPAAPAPQPQPAPAKPTKP